MTEQEMLKRIAELEALVARKTPSGSIKVSVKGAVSYYGLGRFPVTLYGEQWKSLAEKMPAILSFIDEHKAQLKTKPAKEDSQAQAVTA
jgi:hypothetical protein